MVQTGPNAFQVMAKPLEPVWIVVIIWSKPRPGRRNPIGIINHNRSYGVPSRRSKRVLMRSKLLPSRWNPFGMSLLYGPSRVQAAGTPLESSIITGPTGFQADGPDGSHRIPSCGQAVGMRLELCYSMVQAASRPPEPHWNHQS
jgi:hypothetical protein